MAPMIKIPKGFEERIIELVIEDPELHQALVDMIEVQTKAKIALAEMRDRRYRK